MSDELPFSLMDDPHDLANLKGWDEEACRDLLACRHGEMSEAAFIEKYHYISAILILDLTGFTEAVIKWGALAGFLRILDAQGVCVPALRAFNPSHVRAFADDLYATYDDANHALDAALEIHRRIRRFNDSPQASEHPAACCIGLGFGEVLRIGPDHAMGDEMNRASKLGEDTADGYETLITERFFEQVMERKDCNFELRNDAQLSFPHYAVTKRE